MSTKTRHMRGCTCHDCVAKERREHGSEVAQLRADHAAARALLGEAEITLAGLEKYAPPEVLKDDFAYDRLLGVVHECARAALAKIRAGR